MTKDNKVSIKLEVLRDNSSGKLRIIAHFDEKAPNIIKDQDTYFWMPTIEEKDLINEAFQMMPSETSISSVEKTAPPKVEEPKIETPPPKPEPPIKEPTPEIKPDINEKTPANLPPLEKAEDPAIFEVTGEKIKNDDIGKEIPEQTPETPAKEEQQTAEEPVQQEEESEIDESQVAKLFEVDHSGKTVPVEKHAALRKKGREEKQALEAENAQLKAILAQQQQVDTKPLDELTSLLDGDDDDVIEKKDLRKVVEKLPETISQIAAKTTNQALTQVQKQSMASKAARDEAVFRKDHPDYDVKVSTVAKLQLLTNEDLAEIFVSDNVAEAYYNKATVALEALKPAFGVPEKKKQPL